MSISSIVARLLAGARLVKARNAKRNQGPPEVAPGSRYQRLNGAGHYAREDGTGYYLREEAA